MKRKVYLEGVLGSKFGSGHTVFANTPADAMRCLDANFGDPFRKYLIKAHEEGAGFIVEVAGTSLSVEELLMPVSKGDFIITPVPAGSKSGGAKILAAVALIGLAMYLPTLATYQGVLAGQAVTVQGSLGAAMAGQLGTGAKIASLFAVNIATSLAITGLQQSMAPDPSTDSDQNSSYLFNGSEQNIIEGDPVPVLYGRLRVPGQPIAFEVVSGSKGIGSSAVVSSIAFDPAAEIVDDSAATYITDTGQTAPVTVTTSSGGTRKGPGGKGSLA